MTYLTPTKAPPTPPPPTKTKRLSLFNNQHKNHSKLTEHFEKFNTDSKKWGRMLFVATALTTFFTWASIQLGWQENPYHILTLVIWLASIYITTKLKGLG